MKRIILSMVISLFLISTITGCSNSDTVLTIDGESIPKGEAIFVLRELERMYEGMYGKDVWEKGSEGKTVSELAKEAAIDSLTKLYLSTIIGEEQGIILSEEDKIEIDERVATYIDMEENNFLKEDGISEDEVRNIFEYNKIGEKLMELELKDFVVDENELDIELANDEAYQKIQEYGYRKILEQFTVQHILISFMNEDGIKKSEEEQAKAYEQAKEVLEIVKSKEEDFESLVVEYSGDPSKDTNKGIYTFYRDDMVKEFEEAAIALEIGEISDLVKSEFGYHIIKKIEVIAPTQDEIDGVRHYESYLIEKLETEQKQKEYDKIFEELKGEHEIEINEVVWDKVLTSNQKEEEKATE